MKRLFALFLFGPLALAATSMPSGADQFLLGFGMGAPPKAAGGGAGTYTFTSASSSPWTAPAGTWSSTIKCWGAGGNGDTGAGTAGGGGGGEYRSGSISITGGSSYSFTIGAAGSATDTNFGSGTYIAKAGKNGSAGGAGGTGGTGGSAGGGGGGGGSGNGSGTTAGAGGSGSISATGAGSGGGGGGGSSSTLTVGGVGGAGAFPGGGGGGGGFAATSAAGGQGAGGECIVTLSVPTITVPSGLVAFYDFPSSGTAVTDKSTYANTGTLAGGVTYTTTAAPYAGFKAVLFNGTTGQMTAPSTANNALTGDLSIVTLLNCPSAPNTFVPILNKSSYGPLNTASYYAAYYGANYIELYRGNNTTESFIYATDVLSLATWHFIAITMSGTTVTWYIDGYTAFTSGTLSQATADVGSALYIGSDLVPNPSNCAHAAVRLYNRALTGGTAGSDVGLLYAAYGAGSY